MSLSLFGILGAAGQLFRRHWLWSMVELGAASLLATTAYYLFFPDHVRSVESAPAELSIGLFITPYTLLASAILAVAFASAFLRLWRLEEGEAAPRLGAADWAALILVTLFTDHLIAAALILFFIPSILLSGLTTFLLPLLILERRGFGALPESFRLAAPHLLVLAGLWVPFYIVWVATALAFGPQEPGAGAAPDLFALWQSAALSDLVTAPITAFALMVIMAAWRQLRRFEDPSDIF